MTGYPGRVGHIVNKNEAGVNGNNNDLVDDNVYNYC